MPASAFRNAALVALIVALVFVRSTTFSFVHLDDPLHIDGNPSLSPPSLSAIWRAPYANMYLPVAYTAWAGIAAVAGENPEYRSNALGHAVGFRYRAWAFHLANVILHAVNAALVFALFFLLAGSAAPALAGALLFAWHPVQVEPVAWVSGLRDVLSATFSLLALLLYAIHARGTNGAVSFRNGRYAAAVICFLLSVLAKPTAIAVPLMAGLLALRLYGRKPRLVLAECGLMVLVALPAVAFAALDHPRENGAFVVPPFWIRPFVALDAIGFYIAKLASPGQLGIDYGRSPDFVRSSGWIYASPLVALLVGAVYAAALKAADRRFVLSLEWFLLGVLPVLGLVPFFQGNTTVSDRYLYLALLGPALGAVVLFEKRARLRPLIVALLVVFAVRSAAQVETWRDSETVAGHALEVNPKSWIAHNVLAFSAMSDERFNDAVAHFETCAAMRPQYATYRNIATIRMSQKRYQDSLAALTKAVELRPDNHEDHYNIGLSRMFTGDTDGAKDAFRKAIDLKPDFALAQKGLRHLEGDGNRAPASTPQ